MNLANELLKTDLKHFKSNTPIPEEFWFSAEKKKAKKIHFQ